MRKVLASVLPEGKSLNGRDALALLSLGAVVFAVSYLRLEASREALQVNNCIFGADAATYAKALATEQYTGIKVQKHALAVVMLGLLAMPFKLAGLAPAVAGSAALATVNTLAAALIYVFGRANACASLPSVALALMAFSGLGTATLLGITETYGVTIAMIVTALIFFPLAAEHAKSEPVFAPLMAGLLTLGLGFANAPALAFLLVYFANLWPLRQQLDGRRLAIAAGLPLLCVAIAPVLPVLVAEGTDAGSSWHANYLARYATFANFTDLATIANFLLNALVFAFVAPLEFLRCRFLIPELAELMARPVNLIAYGALIATLVYGIWHSLRSEQRPTTLGILLAVVAILAFYLYFNPDEAILYSPQWTVPLVLAGASGLGRIPLIVAGVALLCLAVNLPPLGNPRTHDPSRCCPIPPSTMADREHPAALARERAAGRGR
ncbi:hypothetical protein K3172_07985 [Qipengyuania sp. 6B39]|uniref:hypothetical protein n=1 Tax=Qipengyuania proteolytica TaxID=2867239 RepID=UPI001C891F80|nr:hypothetical protein [Qipengyuania proteolytica]MBX7495794.1 hypothetical protein [Qipengyuania proteolytica]